MITREAAGTLITHAGPEIGVASTKAFSCQLTALFLLAMYLGQQRETLDEETSRHLVDRLVHLPGQMEEILRRDHIYDDLAKELSKSTDFLYLGRGIHFPIALEGALKLKEISYIHAEGYPAGEMKHGPNALIDEKLPVVVLATPPVLPLQNPNPLDSKSSPKIRFGRWTDTVWTLLTLIDCGMPADQARVRNSAQRFMESHLTPERASDEKWLMTRMDLCHLGFWLRVGAYFAPNDPGLPHLAAAILRAQMPDGGWNCRKRIAPKTCHSSFHSRSPRPSLR